jgi:hypothetical protein
LTCRKALCHAADTLPKVCERTMESVPTPLDARHDALDRAAAFPRVMGNVDSLHLRAALPHEERCGTATSSRRAGGASTSSAG